MTDLSDKVNQPKKASDDSGSMEQFGIDEQIKALNYASGELAKKKKNRGIAFSKLIQPSHE